MSRIAVPICRICSVDRCRLCSIQYPSRSSCDTVARRVGAACLYCWQPRHADPFTAQYHPCEEIKLPARNKRIERSQSNASGRAGALLTDVAKMQLVNMWEYL